MRVDGAMVRHKWMTVAVPFGRPQVVAALLGCACGVCCEANGFLGGGPDYGGVRDGPVGAEAGDLRISVSAPSRDPVEVCRWKMDVVVPDDKRDVFDGRGFPAGTKPEGSLILAALVRGQGAGQLSYWSADWNRFGGYATVGVETNAPDWRRVFSPAQDLPDWTTHVERSARSMAKKGAPADAAVRDLRLIRGKLPVEVEVSAANPVRQVVIVDGHGKMVFDSGLLSDGATSVVLRVALETTVAHAVYAMGSDGAVAVRRDVRSLDPSCLPEGRRETPAYAWRDIFDTDRTFYDVQAEASGELLAVYTNDIARLRAELRDASGVLRASVETTKGPFAFRNRLALPLTGLPEGSYGFSMTATGTDGTVLASARKTIHKIRPMDVSRRRDRLTVRDGHFERDGKFFFPILTPEMFVLTPKRHGGILPAENREQYLARCREQLADIAAHGFTAVCPCRWDFSEETGEDLLAAGELAKNTIGHLRARQRLGVTFDDGLLLCEECGLSVFCDLPYLRNLTPDNADRLSRLVLRLRDRNTIALWTVADETDEQVAENVQRARLCKELDPTRLTFLTVINAVEANKSATDVLATDPYPVGRAPLDLVSRHGDRLRNIIGRNPKQTWMLWLQEFGGETIWPRPPTPEEEKCMAYLAMNHGTKGVCWFLHVPPELRNGVRQHPDSWNRIGSLNRRLRELAPTYCLGRCLIRKTAGPLDVAAFEYEGRTLVSIVNPTDKPVSDVRIDVPGLPPCKVSLPPFGVEADYVPVRQGAN